MTSHSKSNPYTIHTSEITQTPKFNISLVDIDCRNQLHDCQRELHACRQELHACQRELQQDKQSMLYITKMKNIYKESFVAYNKELKETKQRLSECKEKLETNKSTHFRPPARPADPSERDIDIVMDNLSISRDKAIEALRVNNNDPVDAMEWYAEDAVAYAKFSPIS